MRHFKIIPKCARFTTWPVAAGLALCLSTGKVQSQQSPQKPATAPPTATTSAPTTLPEASKLPVLIVDMRPEADIKYDLEAARALKPKAELDDQKSAADVIQSKATLDMKKQELASLKSQMDVAKKAGNKSEVATMDRQRQEKELDITLQERLVAVRESQVKLAQARRNLADASMVALESELEMGHKRTGWDSLTQVGATGGSAQDIVSLQVGIRSDEGRVLQAMKARSEKGVEVAKMESQLIERQIGVLEADTAIQQFATRAH